MPIGYDDIHKLVSF